MSAFFVPLSRLCAGAACVALALCLFLAPRAASAADGAPKGEGILIVYFSHSGNTRAIAEDIHARVGGTLFELKMATPYPPDYDTVVDMAKKEQQENARPALGDLPDFDRYTTVFLGFPNWWGTMPMAFFTLLDAHPLAGKTVIPFCTHEGSAFGRAVDDLKRLCPAATILPGFESRGRRAHDAKERVDRWLEAIGFGEK